MSPKRIAIAGGVTFLILGIGLLAFGLRTATLPTTPEPPFPDSGGLTPGNSNGGGGLEPGDTGSNQPTDPSTLTPGTISNQPPPGQDISLYKPNLFLINDPTRGGALSYDPSQGLFLRIDANGNISPFSDERFYNVVDVAWSPDRKTAVIEERGNKKTLFNFQTKQRTSIPSQWERFSFNSTGSSMAFQHLGGTTDTQWLASAELNTGTIKLLTPLGEHPSAVQPKWSPTNNTAALATIPITASTQKLIFIKPDGQYGTQTVIQGLYFNGQWSRDGKWLLYSTADPNQGLKPTLWIAVGEGLQAGASQQLPFATTAEQCSFDKKTQRLIWSGPQNTPPSGYGIIAGNISNVPHLLMSLDMNTGIPTTLLIPDEPSVLLHPVITADGKAVLVENKTKGTIERIPLN